MTHPPSSTPDHVRHSALNTITGSHLNHLRGACLLGGMASAPTSRWLDMPPLRKAGGSPGPPKALPYGVTQRAPFFQPQKNMFRFASDNFFMKRIDYVK